MSRATRTLLVTLAVIVAAAVLGRIATGGSDAGGPGPGGSGPGGSGVTSTASYSASATDATSGLPTIPESSLPPEAEHTLSLIDLHGPFPYSEDGEVFGNYEGLLPQESQGYYHEYTVVTPGASTRGTRRIITGSDGRFYWTADHYESFYLIVRSS